jgi:hypothetical protein
VPEHSAVPNFQPFAVRAPSSQSGHHPTNALLRCIVIAESCYTSNATHQTLTNHHQVILEFKQLPDISLGLFSMRLATLFFGQGLGQNRSLNSELRISVFKPDHTG